MRLKRGKIDIEDEKNLLIGCIVSEKFLAGIAHAIKLSYLQSKFSKEIMGWILDYYKEYEDAPGEYIESIFNLKKEKLEEEIAELIEQFLGNMSEAYETMESYNVEYYLDRAIRYIKKRALLNHREKLGSLLDLDKIDEAEVEVANFKKVSKITSTWVNPFEEDQIERTLIESEDYLMKLPGFLGDFLGVLKRKWLVSLMGPMKRGKCISEDSLVMTSDGNLKKIKNLDENEHLITYNQRTGRFIESEECIFYNNEIKDVVRVKTKTGREVETTLNHPFLTINGWKEVKDIKTGERIAIPRRLPNFGEKSISLEKSRILGYLLGDGGITGYNITFHNTDSLVKKDFKRCVEHIGDRVKDRNELTQSVVKGVRVIKGRSNTSNLLYLEEIKRTRANFKEVPNIILTSNKSTTKEFLKALFTCDGSIWKDRNRWLISYSSSSKTLIDQVYNLLLRFGINGGIKEKKIEIGNPAWEIIIGNSENTLRYLNSIGFIGGKEKTTNRALKEIKPTGRDYYDILPIEISHLIYNIGQVKRKKEGITYKDFWNKSPMNLARVSIEQKRGMTRYSVIRISKYLKDLDLFTLVDSDVMWDRIIEIKPVGKKQTYDITVPIHHNFIADNILVHNTWWLDEFKFAALTNRLKVVSISLEMDAAITNLRAYKRMTSTSEERGGKFIIPIFDCRQNQKGICTLSQRVTDKKLVDSLGQIPNYNPKINYDICTACMGKSRDFQPTIWYMIQERPPISYGRVNKSIKGFERMYGHNNLRTISYPINTVSISDILRDLDVLEYAENFIPDVIIADYMDLFKPEDERVFGRDAINDTWKTAKSVAQNKKILWITATQSNRQSIDAKTVKQGHTGEDIRKLAHVDIMGVLNQTSREKRAKMMRFGILVHRHKYFDDFSQIQVLQQLELGQPYLEGFNYYGEEKEEDE